MVRELLSLFLTLSLLLVSSHKRGRETKFRGVDRTPRSASFVHEQAKIYGSTLSRMWVDYWWKLRDCFVETTPDSIIRMEEKGKDAR